MLIYRINPSYRGNADGPPDEVYLFRPGGSPTANGSVSAANFSAQTGRTSFNNSTNPYGFLGNGTLGDISLSMISGSAGSTMSFYYNQGNAPLELTAESSEGTVTLNWQAPLSGTPSTYRIYRDGAFVGSSSVLSYLDQSVTVGTAYDYHVTAMFTNPITESGASNTVNITVTNQIAVIVGSGTNVNATNIACPINVYYKSLHGQSVYTAAELNALGVVGPINISQIGFNVIGPPAQAMPDYIVRMGHTSATNVANWRSTGLITVWTSASYQPMTTGWNMLTLSTPFRWNGTDNIVIDTAFGMMGNWNSSGTTEATLVTSGYRYNRSDSSDQRNNFSGGGSSVYRPNLKLTLLPNPPGPMIAVSPGSLGYGEIAVGDSSTEQFTIQNESGQTLTGSIVSPIGYTVALAVARSEAQILASPQDSRNALSFSVDAETSKTFDLTLSPIAATAYNGNVVITSNAENDPTLILAVTGAGFIPPTINIDDNALYANLQIGNEGTDSFTITNTGSRALSYETGLVELRRIPGSAALGNGKSERNIAGSTLTLDALDFTPGGTQNWIFTVYNNSPDTEWLKGINVSFPAGVTVNSVSNFVGGSGGDLVPTPASGEGITIEWFGESSSGSGRIKSRETATATVNVSIAPSFVGTMSLPFEIIGDQYNDEPHTLTGTLSIDQAISPLEWFSVQPPNGTIAAGQSQLITGYFSATGMAAGSYEGTLTIDSNDPVSSQIAVNVTMDVFAPNQAPELNLPASFSFAKDGSLTVDFSPFVEDVDGDELTLSYSGATNVMVSIDGISVTFGAVEDWHGTETLTFTVSDAEFSASDEVDIIVILTHLDTPIISSIIETPAGIQIQWLPVNHARSYLVYRSSDPYGEYTDFLGSTEQTVFVDTGSGDYPRTFYRIIGTDQEYERK